MPEWLTSDMAIIIGVIFISSLLRSTFGFGDALIAMPALAISAGIKTAAPLVALVGFTISVTILARNWNKIDFRGHWDIILFSILGIPLGLFYLKGANENLIKIVLAAMLILFSLYNLFKPGLFYLKDGRFSFAFGLVSGALGGAYNTNGPPIIIYGAMRRWPPEEFRLILQGIFTPVNFFIVAGHGLSGLWTETVAISYVVCLPFVAVAIFLGGRLNKKIENEKFHKYVYIIILLIGCYLLYNTL